jgi:hypothetical protein
MNSKEKREHARLLRAIPKDAYDVLSTWAKTAAPGEKITWRYVKLDGRAIETEFTKEQILSMVPVVKP